MRFGDNSDQGALEPAGSGHKGKMVTTFMVMKEGRLIFEGDQDQLEATKDPYISKFVKRRV